MRLAAGLRPDPLGELERSPRPPSRKKGGLLLRGGGGRGGQGRGGKKGAYFSGEGREGKEREGREEKGRGGKGGRKGREASWPPQ